MLNIAAMSPLLCGCMSLQILHDLFVVGALTFKCKTNKSAGCRNVKLCFPLHFQFGIPLCKLNIECVTGIDAVPSIAANIE